MHLEYCDATNLVGAVDQYLAIESAGSQQRRIQDFGPVGRRQQDHLLAGFKAVQFAQQLVQCLLFFVVPAAVGIDAARATDGVEFVDEDDTGCLFARLLEQVAHPCRADPDEHFDELGAIDGKERHLCLTGNRARQQGLAGARWAEQQDTPGHVRTEAPVLVRLLEKADNFLQFNLGFVDTGNIVEANLGIRFDVDFCITLTDRGQSANSSLRPTHAPHDEIPDPEEHGHGHDPGDQVGKQMRLDNTLVFDVVLPKQIGQFGIHTCRHHVPTATGPGRFHMAANVLLVDLHGRDLPGFEQVNHFTVADRLGARRAEDVILQVEHGHNGHDKVPEGDQFFLVHYLALD